MESPGRYNKKVQKALEELKKQLPTFVIVDDMPGREKRLCLLVEKGVFRGMGYLESEVSISSAEDVRPFMEPFADNDYIRNSIYAFAESNPSCRINLG